MDAGQKKCHKICGKNYIRDGFGCKQNILKNIQPGQPCNEQYNICADGLECKEKLCYKICAHNEERIDYGCERILNTGLQPGEKCDYKYDICLPSKCDLKVIKPCLLLQVALRGYNPYPDTLE